MTQIVSLGDMVKISKLSTNPSKTPNETYHVFSIPGFDIGSPEKLTGNKILSNKFTLDKPSILVSKLNPRIHRVWKIARPPKFAICSTEFVVLQPKNIDDFDYLYALTSSADFQRYLLQLVKGTSTSHQRVKPEDLLDFPLPDTDNSTYIGKFVSDIDEKIDLNRKMNETLEQMGQALFRHYYIGNPTTENGSLTIGEVATVIDCLHSKKPERLVEDTGNILLQLNNIANNGLLDLSEKYYISDEDYSKWVSRIEAVENDFVITNVGRSGAVAKIPNGVKVALGRNMTAIRLNTEFPAPGFISFLLNSDFMQKQISSKLDHGTIMSALNVKNIPSLEISAHSIGKVLEHESEFVLLRHMIEANFQEIQTLTNLRDTLLPRLISGKIKI